MFKKSLAVFVGLMITLCFAGTGFAEALTAQMCKDKVIAGVKLIEQNGEAAFATIKDPNGEFRFAGGQGYLWIQDLDAMMVMHPIKPSLDGKNLSGLKDSNGVLFFVAFNEVAEDSAAGGWVAYLWPKPGQKGTSSKVSFVKLAKHGGKEYVVGSGLYDVTAEDVKKEFPNDTIYED